MPASQDWLAVLGFSGPHVFDETEIKRFVAPSTIGAYAIGDVNERIQFVVMRAGRSDEDVQSRLLQYLNEARAEYNKAYRAFMWAKCDTVKAAFNLECTLYHYFKPANNDIHPDRPEDQDFECPSEGCPMRRSIQVKKTY